MSIRIPTPAEIRQAAASRREAFEVLRGNVFEEQRSIVWGGPLNLRIAPRPTPAENPPAANPRRQQPEALRLANERRRAEAIARRAASGLPVTRTPTGRISRARLTPEARSANRRAVLERNNFVRRNPVADIISLDVDEAQPARVFTTEERQARRERAVERRTTRIARTAQPARYPGVKEFYIEIGGPVQRDYTIALGQFLVQMKAALLSRLAELQADHSFKTWVSIDCIFRKKVLNEFREFNLFYNDNAVIFSRQDIDDFIAKISTDIPSEDSFIEKGSGADVSSDVRFFKFLGGRVGTGSFKPRLARGFVEIPKELAAKKALVNVKNDDDKCFMWAVLSALFPAEKDAQRVTKYKEHVGKLDFTGISFPVKFNDIRRFERQNNVSVNVYEYEGGKVNPGLISTSKLGKHVNLLWIDEHYVWIKSLDRLINSGNGFRMHTCDRCLHGFTHKAQLDEHYEHCQMVAPIRTVMPTKERAAIKLERKPQHTMRCPIVVYADFECELVGINESFGSSGSEKMDAHKVVSFGLTVKSDVTGSAMDGLMHTYVGKDAADAFVRYLGQLYPQLLEDMMKTRR